MPTPKATLETCQQTIAAVESALKRGFPPPGHVKSGMTGAIAEAARELDIPRKTLTGRLAPGAPIDRMGLRINWELYRPPKPAPAIVFDGVSERRAADRAAELRARLAAAERRAGAAEEWRESILGLTAEPLRPSILPWPAKGAGAGGRTVIAHLSDVHRGERVSLAEMDGVNKYDSAISRARLGRFFHAVGSLSTEHWTGAPPDEIVIALGGDMIGGSIHTELHETNDIAVPAAVREVGEDIAAGLLHLAKVVRKPIRAISVPGNHGRLTVKPQSKRRAAHNLDMLCADFAEATVKGVGLDKGAIRFFATPSPDAYFSVYGWNFCLTHGDAMGASGGRGYIGPIAPIVKGHRLLIDSAMKTGRRVNYVLTAHFHTTARTSFGWANGSLIGYGEYARDLRADPERAQQNMLIVHEKRGVIGHHEIQVGVPEEGSIYRVGAGGKHV
jgi:hypothetical protein